MIYLAKKFTPINAISNGDTGEDIKPQELTPNIVKQIFESI